MTQEEAKELAMPHYYKHKNIVVASDNSIYFPPDISVILNHCASHNLEAFVIKGEVTTPETKQITPKKKK